MSHMRVARPVAVISMYSIYRWLRLLRGYTYTPTISLYSSVRMYLYMRP